MSVPTATKVTTDGLGRTVEPNDIITAAVFAAYLKCPTKALLLARGEKPLDTFFADMGRNISMAYKAKIRNVLSVKFCELAGRSHTELSTTFVDSETAFYTRDQSAAIDGDYRAKRPKSANDYIPVLYTAWYKLDQSDRLIVSFCALAIGQATGTDISPHGKIVFGDTGRLAVFRLITSWYLVGACTGRSAGFSPLRMRST
jgi:hypothetical protein